MHQYLNVLRSVMRYGRTSEQRAVLKSTGTTPKTLSLFGHTLINFDLQKGFPLVTTKKVNFNHIAVELAWFLTGSTNVKYLEDRGVKIWSDWKDENGDLGNVYGVAWRHYPSGQEKFDQVAQLVEDIKQVIANPNHSAGRRLILTSWIPDRKLHPPKAPLGCHTLAQFDVHMGKLSCALFCRSIDLFLGLPYNIASYALFVHALAAVTGLDVGELSITIGNAHIYDNHFPMVEEQLARMPLTLPRLHLLDHDLPKKGLEGFTPESFRLDDYVYHPPIRGEIAV